MAAPERRRWKAPEGPPLTGGRLVADRLLMALVACMLAAALATTFLKSGPAPVADSLRRSLHIVWIAAPNDRLDLPFLPYASASRSGLRALVAEQDDVDDPELADADPPLRVTPISAATAAQVRSALREALAGDAPGDSLLVYVRGHLVPGSDGGGDGTEGGGTGGGGTSLVCGDARLTAEPAGASAKGTAKSGPTLKGVIPVADLVGLMDAAPARCRLLLLEPGALPLEPALGVSLDDYLAGLAARGRVDSAPTSPASSTAEGDSAAPAPEKKANGAPTAGGPTTILLSRPPHAGEFLRPDRSATRFFAAVRETLASPASADQNEDRSLSLGEFRAALSRAAAPDRPIAIRSGRLVSAENPAADGDALLAIGPDRAEPTSAGPQPAGPGKSDVTPHEALLESIRRSRTRLTALMTPPDEPGRWPLLSAPRRLLAAAALLARTEELVLFEPHSSAELTDIEIGLQKVGRDLDAIEMEAKPIEPTAGTSRDLWQAWADLERARPMLIDAVRLHDRIGHLPRMDWLSPAVQEWAAALRHDAAQFEPLEKPAEKTAAGAKPGPRVRRFSLQGPDVRARLVERPLSDLVAEIAGRLGASPSATAEDIAIVQGLVQSDLLTVEQRMRLLEGVVALPDAPGSAAALSPPMAEPRGARIEVPDFALHPLAKRRFDMHRLLILHFLGEGAIGERELLIDDVAMQLEEASRGPVRHKGSDAGYLGVVYRTMLGIPAAVTMEEPAYVVPIPPTTSLNE